MTTDSQHRLRVGDEYEVAIQDLTHDGRGTGRPLSQDDLGKTLLVSRCAPGDHLRVRVGKISRNQIFAEPLQVIAAGPDRIEPPCIHWTEGCGGCSWQQLSYTAQLHAKAEIVKSSLKDLKGFGDLNIDPIVPADPTWFYRNKMEFTFNALGGLGLHLPGNWRSVIPITDCRLESNLAMRIVATVRAFTENHQISTWNPDSGGGLLHELMIRHGQAGKETMVAFITSSGSFPEANALASKITQLDESIVAVLHGARASNQRGSQVSSTKLLAGRKAIIEQVGGLRFNIGLETFFQTNSMQAERMLEIVAREVRIKRTSSPISNLVLDVFCGIGFFALGLAEYAETVIGIDIIEASTIAARENAELNRVKNALFYTGDARHALPPILEQHGRPDIVVLDPPRSGAGGKVMRRLARAAPQRIVYVSCNPVTLASDLRELEPFGYKLTRVQPIDLFPQTHHVETIATADRLEETPAMLATGPIDIT